MQPHTPSLIATYLTPINLDTLPKKNPPRKGLDNSSFTSLMPCHEENHPCQKESFSKNCQTSQPKFSPPHEELFFLETILDQWNNYNDDNIYGFIRLRSRAEKTGLSCITLYQHKTEGIMLGISSEKKTYLEELVHRYNITIINQDPILNAAMRFHDDKHLTLISSVEEIKRLFSKITNKKLILSSILEKIEMILEKN